MLKLIEILFKIAWFLISLPLTILWNILKGIADGLAEGGDGGGGRSPAQSSDWDDEFAAQKMRQLAYRQQQPGHTAQPSPNGKYWGQLYVTKDCRLKARPQKGDKMFVGKDGRMHRIEEYQDE